MVRITASVENGTAESESGR